MKIGTGTFRYTFRNIEFFESKLLNELHGMCYQVNGGFRRDRALSIVLKLSDEELEQAYWTIGNKGVERVVKDEIKARDLKMNANYDCWILSKIGAGQEYQAYFEKYVCGI